VAIGSVYILLNPLFPRLVKIGRTNREVRKRAVELSRQTGVPEDFVILYDEVVSDVEEVERRLHERFQEYRTKSNKEFFQLPPRDAIKALQDIARQFPAPPLEKAAVYDLLPHLKQRFSQYLDPKIRGVRFLQLPGVSYLEVTRQATTGGPKVISHDELPLSGLVVSESFVTIQRDLQRNIEKLQRLHEYDWIQISDLFPNEIANEIAQRWEETHLAP